jgi:dynein heavy chain
VRKQYESVKPYLPVINDLLNPALKKEHWKRLKEIIKGEIDDDLNVKFDSIRDSVMENREEIRDISEKASKEMGFEKTINKMKSEWRTIKFEMTMFRDTGTYILKGIEPIFDKLDEDIAKTMSISSSPYIKFLERDVKAWMQNLFRV